MAVRNFWIRASIDGQATTLSGGPQSKDGGFTLTIKQRDQGQIITPVHVRGYVDAAGQLVMEVGVRGYEMAYVVTQR